MERIDVNKTRKESEYSLAEWAKSFENDNKDFIKHFNDEINARASIGYFSSRFYAPRDWKESDESLCAAEIVRYASFWDFMQYKKVFMM
jgi:hypothetical protein